MAIFERRKSAVSLRNCVGWSPIYTPDGTRVNTGIGSTIVTKFFANSKTVDIRASHVYKNIHENYFYYPGLAAGPILQNTFFQSSGEIRAKLEVAPVPWRRWFGRRLEVADLRRLIRAPSGRLKAPDHLGQTRGAF